MPLRLLKLKQAQYKSQELKQMKADEKSLIF